MYDNYFKSLAEECELRNHSDRTLQLYTDNLQRFLTFTGKSPDDLNLTDAKTYILYLHRNGKSPAYCNHVNASIAFFYKHVLHKFWDPEEVPHMKIDLHVPDVLTIEEIELLIETAHEIRNKALISLIYSSGIRISETVRIRPGDIHMSTMQVYVSQSKNHRDRWTILSETALDYLKAYWHSYPVSREFLFVSLDAPHKPMKASGIEIMIRQVAKDAGIQKRVYPHLLRHSFATHLLEQGVPIEYIQTLLGHSCPGSTYTYLHIANKTLMGVQSPLDRHKKETHND